MRSALYQNAIQQDVVVVDRTKECSPCDVDVFW